ncbi:mediator of RNA polymerase II transcription subunit 5 [Aspergillus multicolor]|uniref:putative RNA polymerase II mediator complex subunit Nut1 n=1 Tax=Aspergillus multicolor TaxID=41759 RepID=UPI003CCE1AF9
MASEQWRAFVQRCLLHRIDAAEFRDLSMLLYRRCPIGDSALTETLLQARLATRIKWDPLLPVYIDCLCKMGRVQVPTMLTCLLKSSSIHDKPSPGADVAAVKKKKRAKGEVYTLMTDIRIVQDAMLSINSGATVKTPLEVIRAFSAVADWIQAIIAWHNSQLDANQPAGMMGSPDAMLLFEAVGILLSVLAGTTKGVQVLSANSHEALKIRLGQALSAYLPLCADMYPPLHSRLDSLQKQFSLYGQPPSKLEMSMMGDVNVNALQFEASVMDGPVIHSRAGLYVYVNAMLVGRPLVDDSILLNYLYNRYADRYDVLTEEIITASFDVLSNAMYRNESARTMLLFRSFLVNKLPPFFAALMAVPMVTFPMEECISHALSRIDPNTFPSFSQMFSMQGNSALSDVRQEFLFSCASHKLIPESSIERLLGENPMQTLPVGGSYVKDDLKAQISANHERAEQLIRDIESTEGNAGAIVGAITEVMHDLCMQKETMTLKNICNSLSRRPQSLDVMLLFRSPKQILQPLCALLDSWHWDEDQGESQPVYDEFGSVLLLVLTFKYRYDLRPYDLGIANNNSFIIRLIERGSSSQKLEELTEKQNKNLGEWIAALFIDEGISEETMSACSPQEFYMLVSTLFSQSLGACEAGKLEFDTLKGGFEYLLEPFLLPSLVVALTWLGNHIWESEADPTIPLKALHSLVSPTSISGEGREIHLTVLNITARSLEEQLKDVRARHPTRTDIKPILDALDPCLSFQRTGSCHKSELESWSSHNPGGFIGSIRATFQSLILWSTSPDATMAPPSYTHRQMITAIRTVGSPRILSALLDELKFQTESNTGTADIALDIAASLVSAPLPESYALDQFQTHHDHSTPKPADNPPRYPLLTPRDALNLIHESVPKISEKDPLRAELVVRLYRRVNTLLAPPAQVAPNLDMNVNVNMDMNVPVNMNMNIMQDMHLDPSGTGQGGQNMDMNMDSSGNAHAQGQGQGHSDEQANLNQIMDNAAAAVGMDMDVNMNMGGGGDGMGLGLGDQSIDDVLNAAEMNPEFLDLDMDTMFQ